MPQALRCVTVLSVLALPLAANAQRQGDALGGIHGVVLNSAKLPITTGSVSIEGIDRSAVVANGEFTFRDLPNGRYKVRVRSVGHLPFVGDVEVAGDSLVAWQVTLMRPSQTLAGVEIIARSQRDSQALERVRDHQKLGGGTVFLRGNQFLEGATKPQTCCEVPAVFG